MSIFYFFHILFLNRTSRSSLLPEEYERRRQSRVFHIIFVQNAL